MLKYILLSLSFTIPLLSFGQTNFYKNTPENLSITMHEILDNGSFLVVYSKLYPELVPQYKTQFVLALYNECGEKEWAITPDIPENEHFSGRKIFPAPDGSIFLFARGSTRQPVLMKLSATGELLWARNYYMQASPSVVSIGFKDNYMYSLMIATTHTTPMRYFLTKLNMEGEIIWKKRLFVPDSGNVFTDEEGYFVFTNHKSLSKISFEGELIFSKKYFVAGNEEAPILRTTQTVSNFQEGYYIVSRKEDNLGMFVTKTDKTGNVIWTTSDLTGLYGTQDTLTAYPRSLLQDNENNIYIFGELNSSSSYTFSRTHLSKIDSENGNILYRKDISYKDSPTNYLTKWYNTQFSQADTSLIYTGHKASDDETYTIPLLGKIRLNDFAESDCYEAEDIEIDDFRPEVVSVSDTMIIDSMNMSTSLNTITLRSFNIDDALTCSSSTDYNIKIDSLSTCGNNSIVLDATTLGSTVIYNWFDGTNNASIEVDEPGSYQVEITICDSRRIVTYDVGLSEECRCEFEFPTIFTPNGDGVNDTFSPIGECDVLETYKFTIYNRWGQIVFHSENQEESWNGEFKNLPVPADVYVYTFEYTGLSGQNAQREKNIGDITIVR